MVCSGPEPKKSNIRKSTRPLLINYHGETYEIRFSELRNLGIDNLEEVVKEAKSRGNNPMPDFCRSCLYCDNNKNNIERYFKGDSETDENGDRIPGKECTYVSSEVQIVNIFSSKDDGRIVRAVESENCAFYDSLVITLANNGALGPYKVNIDFNFLSIDDFENGNVSEQDLQRFQIKGSTLFNRFKYLTHIKQRPSSSE